MQGMEVMVNCFNSAEGWAFAWPVIVGVIGIMYALAYVPGPWQRWIDK